MSQETSQTQEDALLDELLEDILSEPLSRKEYLRKLLESQSDCI
jgi:hypothetical protein